MKIYKDSFGKLWIDNETCSAGQYSVSFSSDDLNCIIRNINTQEIKYNGLITNLVKENLSNYTNRLDFETNCSSFFVDAPITSNEVDAKIGAEVDILSDRINTVEEIANAASSGSLGSIKPTDAAPTPARNGNYTFSIGGNKPAWLTSEAGVTTVKAGDGVAVVYTEPSSYTYTHVNVSSDFVTIQELKDLGYLFKGIAIPTTNPGIPDGPQFYFATQKGTYSNFGGVVVSGKACILSNATGSWVKSELGLMLYEDAMYSLLALNSATGENSYYINISGTQTNDPNYHSCDFLDVTPGESLFFVGGAHPSVSGLAFYDANKTFLSGTNFGVSSAQNVISPMTVPTGAVYVKASYIISSQFSLIRQSAIKDSFTALPLVPILQNDLNSAENNISDLQSGLFVTNIDYWAQATLNGYVATDGLKTSTDANWKSTDFIACMEGQIISLRLTGHTLVNAISFYNSSQTYISGVQGSSVNGLVLQNVTVPAGASYMRISGGSDAFSLSIPNLPHYASFTNSRNMWSYIDSNISSLVSQIDAILTGDFPRTVDHWDQATINTYITKTGTQYSTDANWRSTDFISCVEGDTLNVRLTGHTAVNNVSFYNESYGFISGVGVTSGSLYEAQVTVPVGAYYIRISGGSDAFSLSIPNLPHYADQDLSVNIFEDLDSMNAKIGTPLNIPYIYPRTIYTTCNNVGAEVNGGRKRNYSAAIVIDHLFNGLASEKEIRIKNGIDKAIFTAPLVVTDSNETTPTITYNGGSNVLETSTPISLKGKDIVESSFNVLHRSSLNSVTSSAHPKILCIGDSITYGEQAFIPDDGFTQNHVYHLIAKELFMKDAIDNGGTGFDATFLGIYEKTKSFNYKGSNYNVKTHHGGIRGISLASHLAGGVFQFWDGTKWSLQSWINKYRTLDDNGVRLTLGSGTGTLIDSGNINTIDVCTPTHVLIMLGANGGGTLAQYQQLVNYIKTEFPSMIVGIAIPDAAGTYFPSLHPKCSELCTIWNDTGSQGSRKAQQYGLQSTLQSYYDNSTQESQNIYMVPFYYVAPSAESVALRKTDIIDADFSVLTDNSHFNHFGWHASTHVNGVGHINWGYQLYSWIKYTIAKSI